MSRLRWPDSTNSVSEKPGTIHSSLFLKVATQPFFQLPESAARRARLDGIIGLL